MNEAMGPDERETLGDDDRRLAALLASVQAEANPAVWARVRTRLAAAGAPATARTPLDGFLEWLTRPAALAAATASLVVALGTGFSLLGTITAQNAVTTESEQLVASDATNLMESLLETTDADAAPTPNEEAGESTAPGDSGGRS